MGKKLVKSSKFIGGAKARNIRPAMSKINPSYLDSSKVGVGDIVEARFTNVFGWQRFPARITKVNKNTVRVVRVDGKPVWEGDDPNREFSIPKLGTENNGIFKFKREHVKRFKPQAGRDWDTRYAYVSAIHFAGDLERKGHSNITVIKSELRPGSGVFVCDVYWD